MTTPSKRSKRSARAAGASPSQPAEAMDATNPIEATEATEATEAIKATDPVDTTDEVDAGESLPEESGDREAMPADPLTDAGEKPEDNPEELEPTVLMGSRQGPAEGMQEPEEIPEEMLEEKGAPTTQPLPALSVPTTQPLPALSLDSASAGGEGEAEGDATMIARTPSRPRKTTLATAFTPRPMPTVSASHDAPAPRDSSEPASFPTDTKSNGETVARRGDEPAGAVADEIDEWSIADQPTVYLSPDQLTPPPRPRRPSPEMPARPPEGEPLRRPAEGDRPPRERSANPSRWLASTDDDRWPSTNRRPAVPSERPRAVPPTDEHMERFQRLREGRIAHQEGNRGPGEGRQVADIVRQWWRDLRPGLTSALNYQHEARASGVHTIPAHEPSPGSRLGDAFGRFAASAREMTGRAQSAMTPRLNRLQELHAQAESRASALVQKMEAPLSRQQAPLLGPGRIAVFFKPGVTVGQAQSLLGASRARPIRLIPRKHGFLALVPPGAEADICERLREHPYIRDVAYVEYDEYGDPIRPPAAPR